MILTFPSNTEEVIDAMRKAIGRDIVIDTPTVSGCSICTLNPVTQTSTNPVCPVCNGAYWIITTIPHTVLAHITWGRVENLGWVSGGQYFDGDCLVQIKYTDTNDSIVASGIMYHVDGRTFIKKNIVYRGVPDINRILVNLMEKE